MGGKVAVDFRAGKNYVGTFYQPWLVFSDLAALETLPDARAPQRGRRGGQVRVCSAAASCWTASSVSRPARCAPRASARRWSPSASSTRCRWSPADEREETGARAVLNLGHTVGHAIEAATAFSRYTHGEAVGLGLRASLWLSRRLCGLDPGEEARAQALLDGLGLPQRLDGVPAEAVCDLTQPRQEGRPRRRGVRAAGRPGEPAPRRARAAGARTGGRRVADAQR